MQREVFCVIGVDDSGYIVLNLDILLLFIEDICFTKLWILRKSGNIRYSFDNTSFVKVSKHHINALCVFSGCFFLSKYSSAHKNYELHMDIEYRIMIVIYCADN